VARARQHHTEIDLGVEFGFQLFGGRMILPAVLKMHQLPNSEIRKHQKNVKLLGIELDDSISFNFKQREGMQVEP
jgi:hypothetical protein